MMSWKTCLSSSAVYDVILSSNASTPSSVSCMDLGTESEVNGNYISNSLAVISFKLLLQA